MAHEIVKGQDGLYTLCIFNAEDTADEEVKNIFEKFGQIRNFHRTKDLVFIRYGCLSEAERCLESMVNDKRFRVRPGKGRGNTDNSDNKRNNYSVENHQIHEDMNRKGNNSGDFHGQKNGGGEFSRRSAGENFSSNAESVPPPLRLITGHKSPAEPKVYAKEVIIGNLPPDVKQCTVYGLVNSTIKCNPLHVAMKQCTDPSSITVHYAYVFVKSDEEVKEIVTGLNNLELNGYRLFVGAVDKLKAEGMLLLQEQNM